MIVYRRRTTVFALGCLCTAGLGFLSGMVTERVRFDQRRSAVISDLSKTEQRLHRRLMDLEGRPVIPEAQRP
jgi:hypothetical protein